MSTDNDPLENILNPDRVYYATGVMLDAEDFNAEQTYHRGRLARVLSYLHGSGTVAGLKVQWKKAVEAEPNADPPIKAKEEELHVEPGIAIDRLGRMVELPRRACIRLNRWYESQDPDKLVQAFHEGADAIEVNGQKVDGVVADVFVRFVACERGKTPAFASGPFDALDAVAPSRLRDGYQLQLFPRAEQTPPVPDKLWPADPALLHDAIFDAWEKVSGRDADNRLKPLNEHAANQDPTFIFLARVVIPAEKGVNDERPKRLAGANVEVLNNGRRFAYTAAALASLSNL